MGADKFERPYPAALKAYAFVQFVAINLLALVFLVGVREAGAWQPWLLVLVILSGCVSLGLLFEGRPGLWRIELSRQAVLTVLALLASLWLAPAQALVAQSVAAFSLLSLCGLGWLFRGQQAAVATGN